MNFHPGARDIRLEQGRYLKAFIGDEDTWIDVGLDLNTCIGHNNGILAWGGTGDSLSLVAQVPRKTNPKTLV